MITTNQIDLPAVSKKEIGFLVILFGAIEYDGRVQRMIEVLRELGMVTLVDLVEQEACNDSMLDGFERSSIVIPRKSRQFVKHFRLACAAFREALRLRPDVVVAEDYFTTWSGWLIAKLVGATLIYDAHELIIPEPTKRASLRSAVWYRLERFVAHRASLVVAANEHRARVMAGHYELSKNVEYMRNIPQSPSNNVSVEDIVRQYPSLLRKGSEERIILYQGYVSLDRGLDRFVRALTDLPQEYRLVIAGDGPDLEQLKEMGNALGHYDRFDCLGKVPNRMLPAIAECADVGIVSYSYDGLNNIYCAPNKIYEYAHAGIPVVTTDQPPLKAVVDRYGIGALIRREDSPNRVAKVLKQIGDNKAGFRQQLEHFVADNRWKDEKERIRSCIEKVLGEVGHES